MFQKSKFRSLLSQIRLLGKISKYSIYKALSVLGLFKLIEAAARAAKLEVEIKFVEQEAKVRQLQLRKEIALSNAEEKTIEKMLGEESEDAQNRSEVEDTKELPSPGTESSIKKETKPIVTGPSVKAEPFDHNTPPFVPRAPIGLDSNFPIIPTQHG